MNTVRMQLRVPPEIRAKLEDLKEHWSCVSLSEAARMLINIQHAIAIDDKPKAEPVTIQESRASKGQIVIKDKVHSVSFEPKDLPSILYIEHGFSDEFWFHVVQRHRVSKFYYQKSKDRNSWMQKILGPWRLATQ